jgi:hypothetical protein
MNDIKKFVRRFVNTNKPDEVWRGHGAKTLELMTKSRMTNCFLLVRINKYKAVHNEIS